MAAPLALSINEAMITFGGKPLFEDLSFNIHENDKICLVGKNGAGKSTLMHMITGEKDLDGGARWQAPGVTVGYLQQDTIPEPTQTVFDYIFSGLPKELQTVDYEYMVDIVSEPLELRQQDKMGHLSGGQVRRAALAKALVEEPDILLLDEPTNHLDLEAIQWLEEYLKAYRGALLCVSHDRTFLRNISDKVFWLDRGQVRVCPQGYSYFEEWSENLMDQERRELENRQKILNQEQDWASRGVKARRKRNVRRVELMKNERDKLRSDKSIFNKTMRKIELEPLTALQASKVVVEFFKVCKSFKDGEKERVILDKFNLRVMRGDRIGILGKNGSGKTSFLKMLIGAMEPDMGKVKLAKTLQISYFDQKRSTLNPKHTLRKTLCPTGGDYVDVNGKPRHVCGYLKDFMFDPQSAQDHVSTLSGGQKNRLMLAKVLANPGSFLILDEPTNDLDMETLDMLEELLVNFEGTLFIVSHDRDFLDQTVSKIIAFEGEGEVEGYVGGYTDYLEAKAGGSSKIAKIESEIEAPVATKKAVKQDKKANKLSFNLQFELDKLPAKVDSLEKEIAEIMTAMADPELYTTDPTLFDKKSRRMGIAQTELEAAEARWLELEEQQDSFTA
jgi:ATP-binding cassette subfamily F protein uup